MDTKETNETRKPSVEHLDDASIVSSKREAQENQKVLDDVQDVTENEKDMGFREAFKLYYKAAIWAVAISATIIMEGYDTSLMLSFFAYPSFQDKYGEPMGDGTNELDSKWQVALSCGASVGTIFGVLANGFLIEKFGHRHVIRGNLVVMSGLIFIPFFAPSIGVLVTAQVLCGITWGIFATMGPTYSSEICPTSLRGYLTAYVNMCWAIGQFVAAGVLQALVDNETEWSFRIPFGIQWVWVIPLFIVACYAPDSPWWLVRRGRHEDAAKSLGRLYVKDIHHRIPAQVNFMIHTNKLEQKQHESRSDDEKGWRGYVQCFQKTNLRRTEIVCFTFALQILSGSTFAYAPSYFFSQAGLNSNETYNLNLGVKGISFCGCIMSWFLIHRFGRRTIFLTGYFFLTFLLLLIGILASVEQVKGIQWAQSVLAILWVASYASSIGPLTFTIVSEMSATRLRAQSIALARCSYNITSLVSNIINPYLLNPGAANLKGQTGFFWFATAFLILVWLFFRLPETKNRTYEELDIIFERRISARKFASYEIKREEDFE